MVGSEFIFIHPTKQEKSESIESSRQIFKKATKYQKKKSEELNRELLTFMFIVCE